MLLSFFNLIETEAPQVKKKFIAVSLPVKSILETICDNADIWLIITNALLDMLTLKSYFCNECHLPELCLSK